MTISVVVPSYNHERYVVRCLESIDAQDHDDLEVIVVDDGSDDETWRLASAHRWRTGRAVQLLRTEHVGAHAALNRGLELATGDWVAICNSDDEFAPARLTTLLAHAGTSRFAFSGVRFIDDQGTDVTEREPYALELRQRQEEIAAYPSIGFPLLLTNVAISTGNFFFHRSLLEQIGYFRGYRYVHDWDFLLRALLFTEPVYVAEPLYRYRLHGANSFRALEEVGAVECPDMRRRFLRAACTGSYPNPLAPSPRNWPVYFDFFVHDHGFAPYLAGWDDVEGVAHWPSATRTQPAAEPHDRFAHVGDPEWQQLLVRSIDERVIDGIEFPRFPISGGPAAHAVATACRFGGLVRSACRRLGRAIDADTRLLDFGVGWGLAARVFLRDVLAAHLFGVDADEETIDECRRLMPYGSFDVRRRGAPLAFSDGAFDLVVAFTAFGRLPPTTHAHWLGELHRVLQPGGVAVVTSQSRRFLEHCLRSARAPATEDEQRLGEQVRRAYPDWASRLPRWDGRECFHVPSGEGADHDGWTMVPRAHADRYWRQWFDLVEFGDDADTLPGAYFVLHKRIPGVRDG